ncbi:MAG: hypothetical protein DMF78_15655 [Acidobacteria bacterium]|nr:MAG: hypothetical protein DMF78_15655 [Acidobacteriota bacterium]
MHPALAAIPGVTCVSPAGGFYVFPNVGHFLSSRLPDTLALSLRLLEETRVAVVPGEGFAAPGYVRVSFARPMDELKDGIKRIAGFLAGLRGD